MKAQPLKISGSWKIEFQNNGKLHVHITTDSFISHHVIRSTWNRLLKNNNYLDQRSFKMSARARPMYYFILYNSRQRRE
jgi:hypothetical protein